MKKVIKRIGIILLVVLLSLVLGAVITATLFEKQLGNKIISALNKQLKSELTVERFDLTVLSTFPNVAANLRGIALEDSQDGLLLEADKLSFNFGLWSFLSSSYQVKSVLMSDGAINIRIDRQGDGNYDIFREDEGGDDDSGVSVSLETAKFQNVEFYYGDERSRQEISTIIEDAVFSGSLSSQQFILETRATVQMRFAEFDGIRYLVGKKVSYNGKTSVDLEAGQYNLESAQLGIGVNRFDLGGAVQMSEEGTYIDIIVDNGDGNIQGVLQLLPEEYLQYLGDFTSNGDLSFQARIIGLASRRENPEISFNIKLEDGRLHSPRLSDDLKDVSFTATFTNGAERNNKSSAFIIENLKGYFQRELLELSLRVDDLDDPMIDFMLDGTIPVESIYKFLAEALGDPRIKAGSGEVEIDQLRLRGRYRDMINTNRISRVEIGGALDLDDAGIEVGNDKLLIDRGQLLLNGNQMSVKDLKIEGGGSELLMNGSTYNVIPVLFADSLNSQRSELEFEADLYAPILDIDQLLSLSPYAVERGEAPEQVVDSLKTLQIQNRERITSFLRGTFNARVDHFNYDDIEGDSFAGRLIFSNQELTIQGATNAMQGVITLNGSLFFADEPQLEAKMVCENISVNEFFRQTHNFGQEVLTEQNLNGTLNAKMVIEAFWDQSGNFQDDKLRVLAGVGINDGRLQQFKLLESFSSFVKIKDLEDIRFVNIQNFLEVRNRTIYLPAMFIQSNAVNLTISGEHHFDNQFRYNLKVNAGQVLADRFKRYDPTLQPKKARRNGFFNLHYVIDGDLNNYEVLSAKRQVKEDFEQSEQRKRHIQAELERAFGRIELIREPEEWKDVDEPSAGKTEFLDFELEGKNSN